MSVLPLNFHSDAHLSRSLPKEDLEKLRRAYKEWTEQDIQYPHHQIRECDIIRALMILCTYNDYPQG